MQLSAGMWIFPSLAAADGITMPVKLVIDVSTAIDASQQSRSTGGLQRRNDRRACWNILEAIQKNGTPIAFSDDVRAEWHRKLEQPVTSESRLAVLWLMTLHYGQIVIVGHDVRNASLRQRIQRYCSTLNDVELLEAAMAADGYVVSADKRACRCFRPHTTRIAELARISWIIPACPRQNAIAWIEDGAPPTTRFLLGPENGCGRPSA